MALSGTAQPKEQTGPSLNSMTTSQPVSAIRPAMAPFGGFMLNPVSSSSTLNTNSTLAKMTTAIPTSQSTTSTQSGQSWGGQQQSLF